MSKASDKAAQQERELRNPITGMAPNSFTQAKGRTLPEPSNVRESSPLGPGDTRRLRALHREATKLVVCLVRLSVTGRPAGCPTGRTHGSLAPTTCFRTAALRQGTQRSTSLTRPTPV